MGRSPKPTELRVFEGNRGKRPIPKTPRVSPLTEEPPEVLGREGRAEWRRLTKEFVAAGVFKRTDRAALLACCLEWERYITAHKTGQDPPRGCLTNLIALWSKLGMTPVDRVRLAPKEETRGGEDPILALLTQGG